MKKFTLVLCALAIVAFSYGQEKKASQVNIDQSKLQFNIGVGLSTWGIPFYIGADYWLTEDITIGLEASFRYRFLYSYHYGYIGGSVNANYHFNRILQLPDNLDFYAGLSAGPYIGFGSYVGLSTFNFGLGGQVGGRYKINDRMWLHGEVGGGTLSGGKIGITLRR